MPASPGNGAEACRAFAFAGLPTSVPVSGIETLFSSGLFERGNPPGEAGEITHFFQEGIEAALDTDAPVGCYWALNLPTGGDLGSRAFWASIELPGVPTREQIQDIHDELASRGASLLGVNVPGGVIELPTTIIVSDIPVGQSTTVAGTLAFPDRYAVLLVASADLPGAPTPTAVSTGTPFGPTSTPAPLNTALSSQPARKIAKWFESEIEDALDIELNITSVIETNLGSQTDIVISLGLSSGPVTGDAGAAFSRTVTSTGGSVLSAINQAGVTITSFDQMNVEGTIGTGSISHVQGSNVILITFQHPQPRR